MAIQIDPDRRLVLSFREVQELTRWPEAMVVDYQGILQDLLDVVDQSNEETTGTQEQIDNLSQALNKAETMANRAIFLNRQTQQRATNLEQLFYAW